MITLCRCLLRAGTSAHVIAHEIVGAQTVLIIARQQPRLHQSLHEPLRLGFGDASERPGCRHAEVAARVQTQQPVQACGGGVKVAVDGREHVRDVELTIG